VELIYENHLAEREAARRNPSGAVGRHHTQTRECLNEEVCAALA